MRRSPFIVAEPAPPVNDEAAPGLIDTAVPRLPGPGVPAAPVAARSQLPARASALYSPIERASGRSLMQSAGVFRRLSQAESSLKSKSRGRSRSSSSKPRRQADAAETAAAPAAPAARPFFIVAVAVAALAAIVVIGLVTWRTIGADSAQPIVSGAFHRDNVLLVTIDTLRRDRVGVYGDKDGLTPNIDRLANAGIRFDDAFTEVPETLPAHTSILTGLTPRTHGIHNNGTFGLGRGPATMATPVTIKSMPAESVSSRRRDQRRRTARPWATICRNSWAIFAPYAVSDDSLPPSRRSFHGR